MPHSLFLSSFAPSQLRPYNSQNWAQLVCVMSLKSTSAEQSDNSVQISPFLTSLHMDGSQDTAGCASVGAGVGLGVGSEVVGAGVGSEVVRAENGDGVGSEVVGAEKSRAAEAVLDDE